MTNSRRFFSGNTLDQAVMQAARHHHVLPDELAYRVLEKRHGFLKIRRGVVIEVDPENPRKPESGPGPEAPRERAETPARAASPPPAAAAPAEPVRRPPPPDPEPREVAPWHLAEEDLGGDEQPEEEESEEDFEEELDLAEEEELDEEDLREVEVDLEEDSGAEDEETFELADDLAEAARESVERLLGFVDLEGVEAEISEGEDRLEIELSGEGEERLLEDGGALLLAIEHLVPRLLRGLLGRSAPCRVDCADFHDEREQRLEDMALEAAAEVRRRRRPQTLSPMSPEERRIVHLALADEPDVRTESHGRGFFKRVTISAARSRRDGGESWDR